MDNLLVGRRLYSSGRRLKSRLTVSMATLLTGFAMTGCDLEWNKPDADVPVASHFTYSRSGPAAPVPDRWADTFGSRELSRLTAQTLDGNQDIAAAVARIAQADAQAKIDSAQMFPIMGFNGTSNRSQTAGTIRSQEGPYRPTRQSLYTLGLNASYQVDFWGKNYDASQAARFLADASRYDKSVVALSSVASLVNAYMVVLASQDRLRIAHQNVETATKVLDAIKARFAVGTAAELDLAQQESVLATQRANIPTLEQNLQQAKVLIAVLVGRTPESLSVKGGSLTALRAPAIKPGLPSQLLLRRPDVIEAETKLVSSDFSVQQARAAMFPQITLTGQTGVESILLKSLFRPEAIGYQLAAQVAQPIMDGRQLQGEFDRQKGRYAELTADYRKQVLTAFSDVENALIAIQQNTEREHLQIAAADASRRAYEAAVKQMEVGTIDIVTLATTETALFSNLDLVALTRLARFQAYVSLYEALGGGWGDPQHEIAVLEEKEAYDDMRGLVP